MTPTNTKITENSPPERKTVFYSDFGGFQSTNENDEPLMTVYFIGVIDIFTEYGLKKRTETFFKKILQGGMISAVKPKTYAKRFMDFVYSSFSGGGEEDEEEKLEKE